VRRAVLLALAITVLLPGIALADTVSIGQYQQRLDQVRRTLTSARASSGAVRASLLTDAQSTLRSTNAVTLPSGETLVVDDTPLASGLDATDGAIDAALARLNAHIALVAHVGAPAVDAAQADARLRDILQQNGSGASTDLLDALSRLIFKFISGLQGPRLDPGMLWPAVGLLGIAVIVFVVATLGRALPERVRREVLVRGAALDEGVDPSLQLRAADEALRTGRPREAIHALFLYAITALASREVIRYDPALTDREILVRAAAIPHADALRDLVGIYERSWFGIREPSADEARRARELALRVAP
jgi:uncharacterized protein DUF4129